MSSRTSASVSVEVKPSVNSPVEFRSEIYHDIESNDDSLSVSLEIGAKISKSLLGRVTYSKSMRKKIDSQRMKKSAEISH